MVAMASAVPEREYGENFPVALRVLPRDIREHLHTVYAVARTIDDTGDIGRGDRTARLLRIRAALAAVWAGTPEGALFERLAATVQACGMSEQPFQDLVEANLVDQQVSRYRTFEDLLSYCRLSAVPIGRMVLDIFGESSSATEALSDDVCIALQLLEHWQDVAEDCHDGRIYLPEEDLQAFGVDRRDLVAPAAGVALQALMIFEIGRAAALLDRGRPLVSLLQGWGQVAVAGYLAGGYATVAALQRSGGDVLSRNTEPRRRDIAVNLAGLLLRPRTDPSR